MANTNDTTKDNDQPIVTLIQKIKDGSVEPKLLSKEERRQCVEVLLGEGMNESAIAQVLKRSEKTVRRDLSEIRQCNGAVRHIELEKEITGELLVNTRIHHSFLMRVARNKDSSASDKIQAELGAWHVLNEFVERMQSLGYMPMQRQMMTGDLYHHFEDDSEKSFEEIKSMIVDIETITQEEGGMPGEIAKEINDLKVKVSKAELVYQVTKVSDKCKEVKETKQNMEAQDGK